MTPTRSIPPVASALLRFVAGQDDEDAIVGDVDERFHMAARSRLWYWQQVLGSTPALVAMHMTRLSAREWLKLFALASVSLGALWIWELTVAQPWSWPMAQKLLAVSPLTPAQTCKACYVLSYGVAALLLSVALTFRPPTQRSRRQRTVDMMLVSVMALVPVIWYWFNPGPYDGPRVFRLFQAGLVVALLVALALISLRRESSAYESEPTTRGAQLR